MIARVYQNQKSTLPFWASPLHLKFERGAAYETDTHFVHLYGEGSGLWTMQPGLVVTGSKTVELSDWATRVFGAEELRQSIHEVGTVVAGVWRPGLIGHARTAQVLGCTEPEQRSAEQALRMLVESLDELLLYVEPDEHGLMAYSHKARSLLILACTEIENTWQYYMRLAEAPPVSGGGFNTKDYVRLCEPLFLSEYEITFKPYGSIPPMRPFLGWDPERPTRSLEWYSAYNETKHDRTRCFSHATLKNCVTAIAANLVLFCVRFGPLSLLSHPNVIAPLVNHLFAIQLCDCDPTTFYVPQIELPENLSRNLNCWNALDSIADWTTRPFRLIS